MFAKPRPKKPILPTHSKKRKATHAVEEVTFDNSARQEYLTGFHKRKVQRQKHAQEEAAKRAREEKIEFRKQVSSGPLPLIWNLERGLALTRSIIGTATRRQEEAS